MPVVEPATEDDGGDGLHRLTEAGEREAMDALQDAALAPFDGVRLLVIGPGALKDAAHGEALHLHNEQGLAQRGRVEVQERAE